MRRLILILCLLPLFIQSQTIGSIGGVDWSEIASVSTVNQADIASVSTVDAPASASYLLDTYTGAGGAWSLRKLRSAYAGAAIRIERASDNAQTDIGFSGEDLNVSAINSHCTGTSCYVKIIYDQEANGYDLAISTSGAIIYQSGSVVTLGGKPAVIMPTGNEATGTVEHSDFIGSSQFYHILVGSPESAGALGFLVGGDGTFSGTGTAFLNGAFTVVSFSTSPTYADDTQYIIEVLFQNSSTFVSLYADNSLLTNDGGEFVAAYSPSGSTTASIIGDYWQETIIWPINQASNRAAIYSNVAAYW